MNNQINPATEELGSLFASMKPYEQPKNKRIEFSHRGLLLQFNLDSDNNVLEIRKGSNRKFVDPSEDNFEVYCRFLRNKLGNVINRI